MKLLTDLFPLLVFFAAYKLQGIFFATAAAIGASLLQVGWLKLRGKPVGSMQLVALGVIVVFGGMTLAFQDDVFIKWKPTIVYWIFATVVLGSHWFGPRTAVEFVLGAQLVLSERLWRRVNLSWGVFFLALGALNLYMAFFYGPDLTPEERTSVWVNFKVFGLLGITLAFVVVQMLLIARHATVRQE